MKKSLVSAFLVPALLLFLASCGGGSDKNDDSVKPDADLTYADDADSDDTGDTDDTDAGIPATVECTGISVGKIETYGYYSNVFVSSDLAGFGLAEGETATLEIGFYANPWAVEGSYDLASEINSSVRTCEECVLLFHYDETGRTLVRQYFQERGTVEITKVDRSGKTDGVASAKLVEARSYDDDELELVEGGACVEFEGAAWNMTCVPDCEGRICGPDGCGGTCGEGCGGRQCNAAQDGCVEWDCTQITLPEQPDDFDFDLNNSVYFYHFAHTPAAFEGDYTAFDLYSALEEGDYDLSAANYATCELCIQLFEGVFYDEYGYYNVDTRFFQQSGTVSVSSFDERSGAIEAEMRGVRLVETEIDDNYYSVEVPGGRCYEIASAPFSFEGGGNESEPDNY